MRRAEIITAIILGFFPSISCGKAENHLPGIPMLGVLRILVLMIPERQKRFLAILARYDHVWLLPVDWRQLVFEKSRHPQNQQSHFLMILERKIFCRVNLVCLAFLADSCGWLLRGDFSFLIYYIRFIGKHSWLATLSVSLAIPTVGFFFFDVAMRIVLPKGYSEPLFIPLYELFL